VNTKRQIRRLSWFCRELSATLKPLLALLRNVNQAPPIAAVLLKQRAIIV
jgi:hypothetical protein